MKQPRDYLKWAALLFALVATMSAEYELALAVGFNQWIAAAVPGALDVYVIRAMRQHRDVIAAVVAMIAVNAASHLVTAGLIPVSVPLVVAVSAIAPLVLYRVHHISRGETEAVPAPVEQPPVSAHAERLEAAPAALTERPVSAQDERPAERAQAPADERPSERPQKPKSERRERAQTKPKTSAPKSVLERRRERARRMYDDLGRRPEWTEIRDVLVADKLAPKTISRPTIQRIRDHIEAAHPELAALGSDNVRALTGS